MPNVPEEEDLYVCCAPHKSLEPVIPRRPKKVRAFAAKLTISKDRTQTSGFVVEQKALLSKPPEDLKRSELDRLGKLKVTRDGRFSRVHSWLDSLPAFVDIHSVAFTTDQLTSYPTHYPKIPIKRNSYGDMSEPDHQEHPFRERAESQHGELSPSRLTNVIPHRGTVELNFQDSQQITLRRGDASTADTSPVRLHVPHGTRPLDIIWKTQMPPGRRSTGTSESDGDDIHEYDSEHGTDPEETLANTSLPSGQASLPKASQTYIILHRDYQGHLYFDPPKRGGSDRDQFHEIQHRPRFERELRDYYGFIEENHHIDFVIIKNYSSSEEDSHEGSGPDDEGIRFASSRMKTAVINLISKYIDFQLKFPRFSTTQEVQSPYLFMYFMFPGLLNNLQDMCSEDRAALRPFVDHILQKYGTDYQQATTNLSRGIVSAESLPFLYTPGDIVIGYGYGTIEAYEIIDNLQSLGEERAIYDANREIYDDQRIHKFSLSVWNFTFDGALERLERTLDIDLIGKEAIPVRNLSFYPLAYADSKTKELLHRRGTIFWKCRHQYLVSLSSSSGLATYEGERYMIDHAMYQKIHGNRVIQPYRSDNIITLETMASDIPPGENLIYLLPTRVVGFSLRKKTWEDLWVDRLSDPTWNKQAFENLVIEPDIKKLIQALISSQVENDEGTDLIRGKGNGLILLLHGAPGTGKTFTAESVAEMAERPLYRVTCGDIGTNAEEAETYLESVLELGKAWHCVVLLDEADVFLEERSLEDLERNALVSVFLRVIEYYDGILVLTSNRVGTFDQAFKSRIQLALHYENLKKPQRRKIWRNFIKRLEKLNESASLSIDIDDLYDHIDELAEEDMNGREIRNAITTARQLAKFEGKELGYEQLKYVIGVAGKFDTYIRGVNAGRNYEQIARDDGLR